MRRLVVIGLAAVAVLVEFGPAFAAELVDEPPGWPNAACAIDPDGAPVHCRCLFSDPVGLPVDDPAECPPPTPTSTVVVDCWLPSGEPCSTTSTTLYRPTPADRNDLPVEPVLVEPAFTG